MKFPHIKTLGAEKGWYRVGPLARVQVCDTLRTPLAEAERETFLAVERRQAAAWRADVSLGADDRDAARGRDGARSARRPRHHRDGPDGGQGPAAEEAVGVIEAPRGTLFHHYRVDENDLVTYCNLIVSTTNNNQAMNESIRAVASRYLSGRELTEGLLNHIEVAIRAYDPCLSPAPPMRSARCRSKSSSSTPTARSSRAPARAEPGSSTMRIVVFGWGNDARGDDGLGPLAAGPGRRRKLARGDDDRGFPAADRARARSRGRRDGACSLTRARTRPRLSPSPRSDRLGRDALRPTPSRPSRCSKSMRGRSARRLRRPSRSACGANGSSSARACRPRRRSGSRRRGTSCRG